MILHGKTDVGKRRKDNQDNFMIRRWNDVGCALGVVCDGMGGAMGGNIASSFACERFVEAVDAFVRTPAAKNGEVTEGDIATMLAHAVSDANKVVFQHTEKNKSLKGMGTTLVAALVIGHVMYAVNVGDSRLYLYNKGRMMQITRDHSLVQYLMDAGKLTKEEAKDFPNRNVITRAIGTERSIEADIFSVDLSNIADDACALLCSDGLSAYVETEQIRTLLTDAIGAPVYDGEAAAAKMIDAANEAGGPDNITVVLIRLDKSVTEEGDNTHGNGVV